MQAGRQRFYLGSSSVADLHVEERPTITDEQPCRVVVIGPEAPGELLHRAVCVLVARQGERELAA
jgi:hypothetical protein